MALEIRIVYCTNALSALVQKENVAIVKRFPLLQNLAIYAAPCIGVLVLTQPRVLPARSPQ